MTARQRTARPVSIAAPARPVADRSRRAFGARTVGAALLAASLAAVFAGCAGKRYDPEQATRPWPRSRHDASTAPLDIEIFRRGDTLTLVNATTRSFESFDLWLNQRFVAPIESLPAGGTIQVPLSRFWDRWGGSPELGGLLRRFEPTPIRLAQIDLGPEVPLLGLIVIPSEDVRQPRELQG